MQRRVFGTQSAPVMHTCFARLVAGSEYVLQVVVAPSGLAQAMGAPHR